METLENQSFSWLGDIHELSPTSLACGKEGMGHFMTLKEFCWKWFNLLVKNSIVLKKKALEVIHKYLLLSLYISCAVKLLDTW